MAKKRESSVEGVVGVDVAIAQAQANPSSYVNRWSVLPDGTILPKATASNQMVAPAIAIERHDDGSMSATLPMLATGTAGWGLATAGMDGSMNLTNLAAPPDSNIWGDAEFFGMWDTVLDQRDGKYDMRRALRWWYRDPIVYACIKLLCHLSNAKVNIKSTNDDAAQLVNRWFDQAMPDSFRKAFYLEYFRTSYVPILKTLVKYEPRDYKPNKIPKSDDGGRVIDRTFMPVQAAIDDDLTEEEQQKVNEAAWSQAMASYEKTQEIVKQNKQAEEEYYQAKATYEKFAELHKQHLCSAVRLDMYMNNMYEKQYKWLKGQVAGGYTILNPLLVDIKGPETMAWLREPYLQVSGDVIAAVCDPTPIQQVMLNKMPVEIVQQIKNGATYVWLSPNICTIVCKDKQPYERYPRPMMRHCFDALTMKYDIMAMDQATVRGVKSRILLVKIGNDQYPVTDTAAITQLANIFNSVGRTGTFFWNHTIEMEWIEPDLSSFANADKYKHVNDEIRSVFGVAPILTGTAESGGSIGNHIMNFKGVEQEVISAQKAFKEFLEKEIRMLKASLNISADIEIEFERLNLKDEVGFWQVVCQAVLNGILDHQTALETLGFHFPQIQERMKNMQPLKKKGLFVPQPSANNLGPDGTPLPTNKGPGGAQKVTKKANKNKNKTNKSQPKKAKASMRAVGEDVYVLVESELLEDDQRQDIAGLYGAKLDQVLTVAEFKEKHPEVDMNPDWPDLNPLETVSATMAAAKIMQETESRYQAACDKFKAEGSGDGPRGAYLTPAKKEEFKVTASIDASFNYLKAVANVDSLPAGWDKHYDKLKKSLSLQLEGTPANVIEAHAFAMAALRFKKSMA